MAEIVYSNKINRARTFALVLVFVGIAIMYGGILAKKIPWLMVALFIIGLLSIILSSAVYFWIGMLSTRAISIICPNCDKQTKMLGRVDACMHCKQPLTLDEELEGKEFDEKYNSRHYNKDTQKN